MALLVIYKNKIYLVLIECDNFNYIDVVEGIIA